MGRWPSEESVSESNDAEGIARLGERSAELKPPIVVSESTGRLEVPPALEREERGISYRIVNPRMVRQFARAMGKPAKTDRIDAVMSARWAESAKLEPKAYPIPHGGNCARW